MFDDLISEADAAPIDKEPPNVIDLTGLQQHKTCQVLKADPWPRAASLLAPRLEHCIMPSLAI